MSSDSAAARLGADPHRPSAAPPPSWRAYALALGACIATAVVASPLRHWFDQANTAMLFVLVVVLVAIRLGRRPAILAALTSVGLFDFFFVPPPLSFAVADVQYLVTFVVMLVVALTISHLTTGLALQVGEARRREAEVRALYAVAQRTAGTATVEQLVEVLAGEVRQGAEPAALVLILPDEAEGLRPVAAEEAAVDVVDLMVAREVYRSGQTVLTDAETDQSLGHAYLPVVGATRPRGVLVYALEGGRGEALSSRQARLEALRVRILHTSETQRGQIYVPTVNWLMLAAVVVLVLQFRSSGALAAAYGIAVSGTMMITSLLTLFVIARMVRRGRLPLLAGLGLFLGLEALFFTSNLTKIAEGGWMPLALGLCIFLALTTWKQGTSLMADERRRIDIPMADFLAGLAPDVPRIAGTAVYRTSDPGIVPSVLFHNSSTSR